MITAYDLLRRRCGLSHQEAAAFHGVRPDTVASWCAGRNKANAGVIRELRALEDTTLLLVTHRMAMLPLVDRLVVLDRGRVVADGPRDEVLRALAQATSAEGTPAQRPVKVA